MLFFELLEFLRNIFQVAVKKLSLSHRSYSSSCFLRISPPSTRRNCNLLPYFVERPIFSQYYVLNICSFLLFLFYSVFNDHGFCLSRFRSPPPFPISVFFRVFDRPDSGPGGDDGNRTHDPLLAGQVLSQLSYTPIWGRLRDARSLKIEQQ